MPSAFSAISFSPGSKNWIAKFFELYEQGVFELDDELIHIQTENLTHFISHQTGLIYGTPRNFIFSNALNKQQMNTDEQLKLLLFETHFFTYLRKTQQPINKAHFITLLSEFYASPSGLNLLDRIQLKLIKSPERKLELILESRVKIKTSFFGINFWLNHLSNAFIFLDVILFRSFLDGKKEAFHQAYQAAAISVLNGLLFAGFSDQKMEKQEQKIFKHFLISAALPKKISHIFSDRLQIGIPLKLLKQELVQDPLLQQITYEYGHFLIQGTHEISQQERLKLQELGRVLQMTEQQMLASEELCSAFIAHSTADQLLVYKQSTDSSFAYKETSKRWLKIIGRNRDRLISEIKESKELMALLQKSTKQELSSQEKEQVKEQVYDILKSMPSLALFLLPGGTLILPIVMKLVPELIPSAFKINEVEKKQPENEM
ncbi:MAG: LETM1 domain-containing protein [Flavobacteriales bacterium]